MGIRHERGKVNYKQGHFLERVACLWLMLKGYSPLKINFNPHVSGAGEIDLIMKKGKTIIFVEVKKRPSLALAAEAVNLTQQQRIICGAEVFFKRYPFYQSYDRRYDILWFIPSHLPVHIKNAFWVI